MWAGNWWARLPSPAPQATRMRRSPARLPRCYKANDLLEVGKMATDVTKRRVAFRPDGAAQESIVGDYTEAVVPGHAKRSNFRMLLIFLSMQLVFGAVLVGYSARFANLTFGQLILAMAIAAATMTLYCIGSANVGAVVGQTHAVTTRGIFGRIGSAIVSLLLVIDGMGFYLFTVIFIISLGQALLGTLPALSVLTAALALVMIVNNYFGFTGLARFAQFVAGPVMGLWGLYAVIKTLTSLDGGGLGNVPHPPSSSTLLMAIGAQPGVSTSGNDPDVFRYARAGKGSWWNLPTLAISYFLGAFLFPIMGYLVAVVSNEPDFSKSIRFFAN